MDLNWHGFKILVFILGGLKSLHECFGLHDKIDNETWKLEAFLINFSLSTMYFILFSKIKKNHQTLNMHLLKV